MDTLHNLQECIQNQADSLCLQVLNGHPITQENLDFLVQAEEQELVNDDLLFMALRRLALVRNEECRFLTIPESLAFYLLDGNSEEDEERALALCGRPLGQIWAE